VKVKADLGDTRPKNIASKNVKGSENKSRFNPTTKKEVTPAYKKE